MATAGSARHRLCSGQKWTYPHGWNDKLVRASTDPHVCSTIAEVDWSSVTVYSYRLLHWLYFKDLPIFISFFKEESRCLPVGSVCVGSPADYTEYFLGPSVVALLQRSMRFWRCSDLSTSLFSFLLYFLIPPSRCRSVTWLAHSCLPFIHFNESQV